MLTDASPGKSRVFHIDVSRRTPNVLMNVKALAWPFKAAMKHRTLQGGWLPASRYKFLAIQINPYAFR